MERNFVRVFLTKASLLILAGLFVPAGLIAGTISVLSCDACEYESGQLYVGSGFAGIENTIIFCPHCQKYMAIPTKAVVSGDFQNKKIIKPIAEEVFLGQKCLYYSCPKCRGKAYDYQGKTCPLCLKGKISKLDVGDWD